jgi:hypothetical protein
MPASKELSTTGIASADMGSLLRGAAYSAASAACGAR